MKLVKRWGVMTLVALLVLGSMGAALADDGDDGTEPAAETLTFGSDDGFALEWAGEVVNFVFHWGLNLSEAEAAATCDAAGTESTTGVFFNPAPVLTDIDCFALNVEGPNGQRNHGSMVSAFVHWLKEDGSQEALSAAFGSDMPKGKGKLVSQVAKYSLELPDLIGDGYLAGVESADDSDDGNGPPAWVEAKKAEKIKGKNK